jgi:L-ascorbate metabolism protein UlaG (beta-lactamase superfamily)
MVIKILIAVTCCLFIQILSSCSIISEDIQYLNNPDLETVKLNYKGNHFQNGKFGGKYTSDGAESLYNFIKWKLSSNPKNNIKEDESYIIPVTKYDHLPHEKENYIMWLGHSTVLIRINGKTILTDPVLTSPTYLHSERLTEVPLDIKQINVNYLLASHGHRDHLDEETVQALLGNSIQACLPLKMGSLVQKWNPNIKVQEAGWYQKCETSSSVDIFFLPAYHWHRRTMFDLNTILWGSYVVQFDGITIYFAGDSGYSSHFKEIGKIFGDIDYAILPIGSYDPPFMMQNNHMTPEEAVQAFQDLKAKVLIPIHYGTFDLTDEPLGEPVQRLKQQIEVGNVKKEEVKILTIGEIMAL